MAREMKDSGIEWIGEIPSTWNTVRFKYLHDGLNTGEAIDKEFWSKEESDLVFYTAGLTPIRTKYLDFPLWKFTQANDILLARNGTPYVYFPTVGACYTDHIIRASMKQNVNRRFVQYALQQSIASVVVDSVSIATWSASLWNAQYLPWPTEEEQNRIVDFLDHKCAEIDSVIAKTQRTIEEYKSLKQSIITEAVTKGVRGKRPMKDSGIEWIGEIPVEWEIRKLFRAIDNLGDIDHYMPNSVDTGIPYLMTGDLKEKLSDVDFDSCKMVSLDDYQTLSSKIKANKGDIIFARYATIGTVCFVDIEKEFLVSYSCLTIKPTENLLLGRFLFYYLKSSAFFEEVNQYINSNTQANVGLDSMTKAKVILPKIEEQTQIADYLDKKCAEIDILIAKKTALLEELESYKKSVIYEYVTGKKEVPACQ